MGSQAGGIIASPLNTTPTDISLVELSPMNVTTASRVR